MNCDMLFKCDICGATPVVKPDERYDYAHIEFIEYREGVLKTRKKPNTVVESCWLCESCRNELAKYLISMIQLYEKENV